MHAGVSNFRGMSSWDGLPWQAPAAVAGSFLLWTNIYLLLYALFRNVQGAPAAECACRAATVLHAVLLSWLGLASTFFLGPSPFVPANLARQNTTLHTDTILLSLGYFLFDLAWCLWTRSAGPVMLLHHAVSLFGLGHALLTGRYGCEVAGVLGTSEITNPLLQLRWFLKKAGRYPGAVERLVDWSFASLFCVIRLGVGSYFFFFVFLPAPQVEAFPRLCAAGFYVISVVFSVQVARYVSNKYFC